MKKGGQRGCLVILAIGTVLSCLAGVLTFKFLGLDLSPDAVESARAELKSTFYYGSLDQLLVGPYPASDDAAVILKKIDQYTDQVKDPFEAEVRDAYNGYGFDQDAARYVFDRHPGLLPLAVEAADKPKLNLSLKWNPPDPSGDFRLDFAYDTAGRILIVKGLEEGAGGNVTQAVEYLAKAEHLAEMGTDQTFLRYRRVPNTLAHLVDYAVLYLSRRHADNPEKLSTLLSFADRPRKGKDMARMMGAETLLEIETLLNTEKAVATTSLANKIDPSTANFTRRQLIARLILREVRWAKDVKAHLGNQPTFEEWAKALQESREKFLKNSGGRETFFEATNAIFFPLVAADVVKITRPVDRKRMTAAYIKCLLFRIQDNRLPHDLGEAGVDNQSRLGYAKVEDGFMVWIIDPAKPPSVFTAEDLEAGRLPTNCDTVAHYRPRPS